MAAPPASTKSAMTLNIKDIEKQLDLDGDGKIDPEEKEILDLLKTMDVDGDGTIGLRELVNLGNQMNESKKSHKRMQRMLYVIAGLCLVFCGVMFVVCFAAVEAGKDNKPNPDGTMKTVAKPGADAKTVAINSNVNSVALTELYTLDSTSLRQISSMAFQLADTFYSYTIVGFKQQVDTDGNPTVTLNTVVGDKIVCSDTKVDLILANNGVLVDLRMAEMQRKRRRALLQDGSDGTAKSEDKYEAGVRVGGDVKEFDEEDFQAMDGEGMDHYEGEDHKYEQPVKEYERYETNYERY